jgi:hypothetical protein
MLVICAQHIVSLLEDGQKRHIQPVLDVDNLEYFRPYCEHETYQQEEYQHIGSPDKIVQKAVDFGDSLNNVLHNIFHKIFPFL